MPVTFTLPLFEQKPSTVKDMVFSILMTDFPLSLIQLLNHTKSRYGVSVTFQAVRDAVLQLMRAKVLIKEGKHYSINREWILEAHRFVDSLEKTYFKKQDSVKNKIEVGQNMSVYTFPNLLTMDRVWNDIITDNFASNPNQPKIMTFESMHFWWVIVTLAQETALMRETIEKGIKHFYICYGNTPLDAWAVKHYNEIGLKSIMLPKPKDFIEGNNIGAYGDLIIQTMYSKQTAEKITSFFRRYKRIEDIKLNELIDVVNEQTNEQLSVIKDSLLAKTMRERVIRKS